MNMAAVQNSKGEIIQLILSRKGAYKVQDPSFREIISWIISPFKFWTVTIFLHAHLQVVYYKCVKFHKNPISGLGGRPDFSCTKIVKYQIMYSD
jgi:hypothetical protein